MEDDSIVSDGFDDDEAIECSVDEVDAGDNEEDDTRGEDIEFSEEDDEDEELEDDEEDEYEVDSFIDDTEQPSVEYYDDDDDDDEYDEADVEVVLPPTPASSKRRRGRPSIVHTKLLDSLDSARASIYVTDDDDDDDDDEQEQKEDRSVTTTTTTRPTEMVTPKPSSNARTATSSSSSSSSRLAVPRRFEVPDERDVSPHNLLRTIRRLSVRLAQELVSGRSPANAPVLEQERDDSDDDNEQQHHTATSTTTSSAGDQPPAQQTTGSLFHSSMAVPNRYELPEVQFGPDEPSGLDDAEKDQWNYLVTRAREAEKGANPEAAYQWFAAAARIHAPPKLQDRLSKLQSVVNEQIISQYTLQPDGYCRLQSSGTDQMPQYRLPGGLVVAKRYYDQLFGYQRQGVRWYWSLHLRGEGGILGDDMGLGKTMQTLTFLRCLFDSNLISRVLIVLPVAVMVHWKKEIERWCPGTRVALFHGTYKKGREAELSKILRKGGICLTSYGLIVTNVPELSDHGNSVWDYVILDEGHKIKNPSAKVSKAIREIGTRYRVVLSGTPIQNNLSELWALFDFVCQGRLLGTYPIFKQEFESHIVRALYQSDKEVEPGSEAEASRLQILALGNQLAEQLALLIEPFFLRREKQKPPGTNKSEAGTGDGSKSGSFFSRLTQPLPNSTPTSTSVPAVTPLSLLISPMTPSSGSRQRTPSSKIKSRSPSSRGSMNLTPPSMTVRKNDFIVWLPLTEPQLALYRVFGQSEAVKQALNNTGSVLAAITVLKKICDHPALLHEKMKSLRDVELAGTSIRLQSKERFDPSKGELVAMTADEVEECVSQSSKMHFVVELLQRLRAEGHRVLIFSQSTRMLNIVQGVLASERLRMRFVRIDGSISNIDDRQQLIDRFNSDESITCFLLTTQCGGVGISLTGADRVIIFDPAWNDLDNQAVDRAYRLGQKRNVVVYRLMTCGAIEEKIYRKQVFKVGLTRKVLAAKSNSQYRYFSKQELRELLVLSDDPYRSETQIQLARLHSADRQLPPGLAEHIELLHTLGIFGLSDHDLLFSKPDAELAELATTLEASPEVKQIIEETAAEASARLDRTRSALRPTAALGPIAVDSTPYRPQPAHRRVDTANEEGSSDSDTAVLGAHDVAEYDRTSPLGVRPREATPLEDDSPNKRRRVDITEVDDEDHEDHQQQQDQMDDYGGENSATDEDEEVNDQEIEDMIAQQDDEPTRRPSVSLDLVDENDENDASTHMPSAHSASPVSSCHQSKQLRCLQNTLANSCVPLDTLQSVVPDEPGRRQEYERLVQQAQQAEEDGDLATALNQLLSALEQYDREKWLHIKIMRLANELQLL